MRNNIRIYLISILFFSASNAFAQTHKPDIPAYGEARLAFLNKMYSIQDKIDKDSDFALLYNWSKNKEYKKVLHKVFDLMKNDQRNEPYTKYYLSALYNLGQKDSARKLAHIQLKKVFKNGHYTTDLFYFFDNPFFYKIGIDSNVSTYALTLLKNEYSNNTTYKNKKLGLALIDLYYNDQMLREKLDFKLMCCNSQEEARKVWHWFIEEDSLNAQRFKKLYHQHPKYITEKEVGFPANYQELLVRHMPDSYLQKVALPRLKNAMEAGKITADKYINMVTIDYLSSGSGNAQKCQQMADSLCKRYGCKNKFMFYNK